MKPDTAVDVPTELSAAFDRYGDLLRLELRLCGLVLVIGFLVFFPAAALFFEWYAAPRSFSDLSFLSLSYWGIFIVGIWVVVRIIWRPIEEKKRVIEAEFSQRGLRIFQVKGTKFDIAELEDK
ncbi:hypothetical protein [uncultured Ruegeria sp.]|uniref:hypothetical protein n=1 Tax=uncultured Ruegeria sp. TaxID=259304 RepID=UPI002618987F|nr:hypothetical protein [uncultured Ruegeria sp.]